MRSRCIKSTTQIKPSPHCSKNKKTIHKRSLVSGYALNQCADLSWWACLCCLLMILPTSLARRRLGTRISCAPANKNTDRLIDLHHHAPRNSPVPLRSSIPTAHRRPLIPNLNTIPSGKSTPRLSRPSQRYPLQAHSPHCHDSNWASV